MTDRSQADKMRIQKWWALGLVLLGLLILQPGCGLGGNQKAARETLTRVKGALEEPTQEPTTSVHVSD